MVAFVLGAGLQAGQVRAGVGLGVTLAPADLAPADRRQVLALEFLAAEFQQRRAQHPETKVAHRRARVDALHFFGQHFRLFRAQAAAAVFLGPLRRGPALVGHALHPHFLRVRLELPFTAAPAVVRLALQGLAHFLGAVRLQPGPGFRAELFEIRHRSPPRAPPSAADRRGRRGAWEAVMKLLFIYLSVTEVCWPGCGASRVKNGMVSGSCVISDRRGGEKGQWSTVK